MKTEKKCPKCGEVKPREEWAKNKGNPDGLSSYCKSCKSQQGRTRYAADPRKILDANEKWRKANPEKKKEIEKRWAANNPERIKYNDKRKEQANPGLYRYHSYRQMDKKKGFTNTFGPEAITVLIAQPCRYCDTEEVKRRLDRIDNSKGHEAGNVVPSCRTCNIARNKNLTHSEMAEEVGRAIRRAREARRAKGLPPLPAKKRGIL